MQMTIKAFKEIREKVKDDSSNQHKIGEEKAFHMSKKRKRQRSGLGLQYDQNSEGREEGERWERERMNIFKMEEDHPEQNHMIIFLMRKC